jgi:hypothetical protein
MMKPHKNHGPGVECGTGTATTEATMTRTIMMKSVLAAAVAGAALALGACADDGYRGHRHGYTSMGVGVSSYDGPRRGHYDQDRDGTPNRYDRDRDGDGVPNRWDDAPRDPNWR